MEATILDVMGKPDEERLIRRRTDALAMKAESATYEQIADALGYSNKSHAWKDVQAGLEKLRQEEREEAERLRVLQRIRLEALLQAVWPQATGQDPARPGVNLRHVEVALKIMERQAKNEGSDAPVKTDLTISTNVDARIVELMEQLGITQAPRTIAGELED